MPDEFEVAMSEAIRQSLVDNSTEASFTTPQHSKKPPPSSVKKASLAQENHAKIKRSKTKPLPSDLINFDEKDLDKFVKVTVIDENGHDIQVVTGFHTGEDGQLFDLTNVTTAQIRSVAKNIGINYAGSKTKFDCRVMMAQFITNSSNLDNRLKKNWYSSKTTNTNFRLINVVFSEKFVNDLKRVNDRKSRQDHKSSNTYKMFWTNVTAAYNSCIGSKVMKKNNGTPIEIDGYKNDDNNEDYTTILNDSDNDRIYEELKCDTSIDLTMVESFDFKALRKKVLNLFKIRDGFRYSRQQ
jgi:hypothetical protein